MRGAPRREGHGVYPRSESPHPRHDRGPLGVAAWRWRPPCFATMTTRRPRRLPRRGKTTDLRHCVPAIKLPGVAHTTKRSLHARAWTHAPLCISPLLLAKPICPSPASLAVRGGRGNGERASALVVGASGITFGLCMAGSGSTSLRGPGDPHDGALHPPGVLRQEG